jgi:hypothetical protein
MMLKHVIRLDLVGASSTPASGLQWFATAHPPAAVGGTRSFEPSNSGCFTDHDAPVSVARLADDRPCFLRPARRALPHIAVSRAEMSSQHARRDTMPTRLAKVETGGSIAKVILKVITGTTDEFEDFAR